MFISKAEIQSLRLAVPEQFKGTLPTLRRSKLS